MTGHLFTLAALAAISLLVAAPVQAFESKATQMIVVDQSSDTVLMATKADEKMFPSSMSKLMTLYVLFDKLKQGGIKLDSTFPVSEKAWRMGGSKMFVHVGHNVAIEDLIRGIVIQSGNDACVVVAEGLGGTEEGFARLMNETGKKIGLTGSHFTNSTGWPDEQHYMTAHDLATLSTRLILDFPQYYHYFAEKSYVYNNITQANRNQLLNRNIGVDGLKTGHTEIAGFGIAVSALDAETGRRLVVVVNGLTSENERADDAAGLVQYGFREFEVLDASQLKSLGDVPVWLGEGESVPVAIASGSKIALPRDRSKLSFTFDTQTPIAAPVKAGDVIGTLSIINDGRAMKKAPVIATESVDKAGFFAAAWRKFLMRIGL